MKRDAPIFVAGHRGLAGSAIVRELVRRDHSEIVTRTRDELDLRDTRAVDAFFAESRPTYVVLAAARVGGILANATRPVDFLGENLRIQSNVIESAHRHGVEKLCFLGSSCIYPRLAPQPIPESALLTGPLEQTNEWYAIAKIAGIKLCQAYAAQFGFNAISLMPTNLYGPGDNFDLRSSHVLPALLRKFHEAARGGADTVEIWGSGAPRREFLFVDDLADAVCHMMEHYDEPTPVNIGTGEDIAISDLARMIAGITGFDGELEFDRTKPDGTPRKLLDVSTATGLGWKSKTSLSEGLDRTYAWYLENEPGRSHELADA